MGMFSELSLVVCWQGNIYIAEASAMSKTNVRLLTPTWMMDNHAEKGRQVSTKSESLSIVYIQLP